MATLKDVAKLACVDVSTVSRALNNTSYVHPDTKARVYAAAKELGYHPNIMAQALRQGRRHTLGMVVPRLDLAIFAEILQGFEHEALALGYSTIISVTDDDPKIEKECLDAQWPGGRHCGELHRPKQPAHYGHQGQRHSPGTDDSLPGSEDQQRSGRL